MESKITYHQQVSFCGKSRCRKCREGIGHGPYWYAYQTRAGHTTRTYIGKELPPAVREALAASSPGSQAEVAVSGNAVTPGSAMLTEAQVSSVIGRSHQRPLIGRSSEREMLHNLLLYAEQYKQQAHQKQSRTEIPLDTQRNPQCMLLAGDAGIGKTRLAEEMAREAQRRGWLVLWGRAYPQDSGIPYGIWLDMLRKVVQLQLSMQTPPEHTHGTGRAQQTERFLSSLISLQSPMSRLSSQDEATLRLPSRWQALASLLPELAPVQRGSLVVTMLAPEQEQLRLREAVLALLVELCTTVPVLIVLDDIQWADMSSCDLFGHLARHLYGLPMLLIGTGRENEIIGSKFHPLNKLMAHMQREHTVTTLHINPLSSDEIGMLVGHLPEPQVRHIQTQAAGNPFFAEELARTTPPKLPETITAALESRMSRLSKDCRQLLSNAAVIGGSFDLSLITAFENSDTTDEEAMFDLLEEAIQAGVLTEEGRGAHVIYSFWHPLLVSHLYDHISAMRRSRMHQKAAMLLQRMHRRHEEEVAATIAHHLVRAGTDPLQVAYYAEMAANRAYVLSAFAEAKQNYGLAAEQLEIARKQGMGDAVDQSSNGVAEPVPTMSSSPPLSNQSAHLMYLLERLAECAMIQGEFIEARGLFERILTTRSQQQHFESGEARCNEAQIQALLWGEIGRTWRYGGDLAQAHACCECGEQVLRASSIEGGLAWAKLRYQEGGTYQQEGRYDEGWDAAQEALKLFEQSSRDQIIESRNVTPKTQNTRIQRTLEGDPVDLGRTHSLLAGLATSMGQLPLALHHLNIAFAIFEQAEQKREIAHISCNIGHVHLMKGEYDLARNALKRSFQLAERIDDTPLISVIYCNWGQMAAFSGKLEEAESWYRRAVTLAERFNDREYMSRWNADLALLLQELGKEEEAAKRLARAWRIARGMQNRPSIGHALVTLANMRIMQAQNAHKLPRIRTRLLQHAQQDVQHALILTGIEAETRTKGQQALTQIMQLRPSSM